MFDSTECAKRISLDFHHRRRGQGQSVGSRTECCRWLQPPDVYSGMPATRRVRVWLRVLRWRWRQRQWQRKRRSTKAATASSKATPSSKADSAPISSTGNRLLHANRRRLRGPVFGRRRGWLSGLQPRHGVAECFSGRRACWRDTWQVEFQGLPWWIHQCLYRSLPGHQPHRLQGLRQNVYKKMFRIKISLLKLIFSLTFLINI